VVHDGTHMRARTCEQFLNLHVGLGLDFVFVFVCYICLGLAFYVFFVIA